MRRGSGGGLCPEALWLHPSSILGSRRPSVTASFEGRGQNPLLIPVRRLLGAQQGQAGGSNGARRVPLGWQRAEGWQSARAEAVLQDAEAAAGREPPTAAGRRGPRWGHCPVPLCWCLSALSAHCLPWGPFFVPAYVPRFLFCTGAQEPHRCPLPFPAPSSCSVGIPPLPAAAPPTAVPAPRSSALTCSARPPPRIYVAIG